MTEEQRDDLNTEAREQYERVAIDAAEHAWGAAARAALARCVDPDTEPVWFMSDEPDYNLLMLSVEVEPGRFFSVRALGATLKHPAGIDDELRMSLDDQSWQTFSADQAAEWIAEVSEEIRNK